MYELNHSAHEGISRGPCNRFWFGERKTPFRLLKINRIEGCLFVGVNVYIYLIGKAVPRFFRLLFTEYIQGISQCLF